MKESKSPLIATAQQLALREKLIQALALLDRVLQNTHHDIRSRYIAFNCKVYNWLDTQDRDQILASHFSHLTLLQQERIKVEFPTHRIDVLYQDILDIKSNFFQTQWVFGENLESEVEINQWIKYCKMNWPKRPQTPYLPLNKLLQEQHDRSGEEIIREFFKCDLEGHKHLVHINDKDVFQFGRSGGWMSIARAEYFESLCDEVEYALDEGFTKDSVVCIQGATSHRAWWNWMRYNNCSPNNINDIIARCNAILWVVEQGKAMVKQITKEYLINEFTNQIVEFIKKGDIQLTAEQVQHWMEGKFEIFTSEMGYAYLRIHPHDPELIETSQGVCILVNDGKSLFKHLQWFLKNPHERVAVQPGMKVSGYEVHSFIKFCGEYYLKVQCHNIPWDHIEAFAKNYLFKPIPPGD